LKGSSTARIFNQEGGSQVEMFKQVLLVDLATEKVGKLMETILR
jgi:hypothetical protein